MMLRMAAWLDRVRLPHVLVAGLLARLLVFAVLPNQHFPDAHAYVETGRALATTGFMSSPLYMPLYPLWTYVWGGAWGVKIGDIIVSTAMIWLIWRLTEIVVKDRTAALIAAAAAAIYPHFLFYAVSGLTETLYAFLLVGAFVCLYERRFIFGSLLLVLGILIRPTLDPLAPILIALYAGVVHRTTYREAGYRVGQYACIYLLLMAPWWAHNYMRYGQFVRLDLAGGMVLYSGDNPLNTSGGGVVGGEKGSDVDFSPFASITDPIKRNAAMERAAWTFIRQNPGRFVELAATKFVRFWRLWPYAGEYEKPWIVAASILSYGALLCFTIVYIIRVGRTNFRTLAPILLLTVFLTAVHMATIASIRYRFPLEPFIVILGSGGVVASFRALSSPVRT